MSRYGWPQWDGGWQEVSEDVWCLVRDAGLPITHRYEQSVQEYRSGGGGGVHRSPGQREDVWLVPDWLHHLLLRRPVFEPEPERAAWLAEVKEYEPTFSAAWRLGGADALDAVVRSITCAIACGGAA